jgi:hypothetical protein
VRRLPAAPFTASAARRQADTSGGNRQPRRHVGVALAVLILLGVNLLPGILR